ncbi:AAA domain-containing protein [Pseudomonas sp. KNUC1026]|uniref:AAA domain-containing protein n=1 Tax=Pseudomonas sp. KNUC1026 TaxID=2893890 RepID=UPI002E3229E9|nr:AAA domain-containing protein [Pseudomonas sp. KNUC1026]
MSIAKDARQLLDTRLVQHLDLLDSDSAAQVELRQARAELERCTLALADAQAATAHWGNKLSSLDTESALNQLQRFENSALRWFSPAWWRLRGELNRRYDFSKHAVHPGFRKVLEQLAAEHACVERLASAARQGNERFGVEHLGSFVSDLDALQARLAEGRGPQQLVALLRQSLDPLQAAQAHANAAPALEKLAQRVSANLILPLEAELGDIAECLRDLREALDELPELLPLLRSVHAIDPACAALLQRFNSPPDALEALVAREALHRLEREQPALARFNGAALAQAAQAVAKAQQQLLALNAQVVCAAVNARFSEHAQRSGLSAAQLDEAGKAFKKQYATGRRELEHEFSKSMRHRSIRDLADDETGQVINDLKPIWLMSPLSVSDTLPLAGDLFDVVIFDEASQIPTEEAVPALSRARQVVVVGDEMQLPPTSFFSAGGSSEDDEILVEEDGERIAINLDADSLLNQAGRNLPATLLAWHYRSRHEALISFSNAAFYDGRLVTIPDRTRDQGQQQLPARSADDEHAGIEGADQLLAQPVSFHAISDGVYEGRRNIGEARYIAQLVRELLRRETPLSLGIVAFSEAQQGAIETALETLAQDDADFATRLDREYLREDDDQFNGLFVKNLENVQGDERDVIILSICYAKGPDGKMLMNFGPINQRGGEKRLNVIFSRARHRMAVVSTIQAEAITNVHNDGAAALRAFLQFAQASASGQFERAQAVLAGLNVGARQAFAQPASADSIRDALAEALRGRGHQVETNVGRSTLRCDLAIVAPGGEGYALGILLDAPHATVDDTHERYTFRPGILRSFGWKVLDVPGKDWIANPQAVLGRVEAMLSTGEDPALQVEVEHFQPVQPPAPAEPDVPAEEPAEQSATTQARVTRLRFEQGASRKFWHARLEGTRFTVSFGESARRGKAA